jgi:hypothetical protein
MRASKTKPRRLVPTILIISSFDIVVGIPSITIIIRFQSRLFNNICRGTNVGTEEGTAEDEGRVDDISEGAVEIVGALLGAVGASEGAAEIVGAAVVHSFDGFDNGSAHFDRVAHAHTPGTLRCLLLLGLTTIWAFLFVPRQRQANSQNSGQGCISEKILNASNVNCPMQ